MRYLILDLETLPIANASDFVTLDDISAPANYKDPEKIAAYIRAEQQKRINEAALDLDLARICVVGTNTPVGVNATVLQTEDEERGYLDALASELDPVSRDFATLVTFCGHRFDLPLLMRRAKHLGVSFPKLNLDRYKSPHIDLYEELTMRGQVKAHALRWYMRRLGWTDLIEADPLKDGSEVAQAAADNRWEDIAAHCRVDVTATLRLSQWLGVVPTDAVL